MAPKTENAKKIACYALRAHHTVQSRQRHTPFTKVEISLWYIHRSGAVIRGATPLEVALPLAGSLHSSSLRGLCLRDSHVACCMLDGAHPDHNSQKSSPRAIFNGRTAALTPPEAASAASAKAQGEQAPILCRIRDLQTLTNSPDGTTHARPSPSAGMYCQSWRLCSSRCLSSRALRSTRTPCIYSVGTDHRRPRC